MKYVYSFIDVAQQEYEEAVTWYLDRSIDAASGFINALDDTIDLICSNPTRWRNLFEDYYELSLKKYPFSLVYCIDHTNELIIIKSVYHHSRNPKRKYL